VQEFGTNQGQPAERFMRTTSTETDQYLTAALGSAMELT
jgi:hypothetical protein